MTTPIIKQSHFHTLLPALALVLGLLIHTHGQAADIHQEHSRVSRAIALLDAPNLEQRYYFSMQIEQDTEQRIVENDPTRAPADMRQLISVDGQPPTGEALAEFREQEEERIARQNPDKSGYTYLVDTDSLVLAAKTGREETYTFTPRLADLDNVEGKLQGELSLDEHTGRVNSLRIFNTQALSPAFSVKVSKYSLLFNFVYEQDVALLDRMESRAVGKIGFLKSFDSRTHIDFTDYRKMPQD